MNWSSAAEAGQPSRNAAETPAPGPRCRAPGGLTAPRLRVNVWRMKTRYPSTPPGPLSRPALQPSAGREAKGWNRRRFLRDTGLMTAAGALTPWSRARAAGSRGAPPPSRALTITVSSDVHLQWPPGNYGYDPEAVLHPLARFGRIMREAVRRKSDVFLDLGDFSRCFETAEEERLLGLWRGFPGERVAVYGNHDDDRQPKAVYMEKMGMPGPYYVRDVAGGWRFIVLDSGCGAKATWSFSGANPDEEQWDWFLDALRATPGRAVVAIHAAFGNQHRFRQAVDRANEEAGYRKVAAFLHGHRHVPSYDVSRTGTHFICINSASYRYIPPPAVIRFRYYDSLPFANVNLGPDGSVSCQGFGERNRWAVHPEDPGWMPPDDMTHQDSTPAPEDLRVVS